MMRSAILLLVMLSLAPAAAQAQGASQILKAPSREDMEAVWPVEAMQRGEGGKAVLQCRVSPAGVLVGCKVLTEEPAGSGFGQAALALVPQFLMKPQADGGRPEEGRTINLPINFVWRGMAAAPGNTKRVASNVAWREAPSWADVVAAFPEKARNEDVGGGVTLSCVFNSAGRVRDCKAINETPFGMGFAGAARVLSAKFAGPTTFADGQSIGGAKVQIRFTFPAEMGKGAEQMAGKPNWSAVPSPEAMQAAIPPGAAQAGITSARVVMECQVAAEGRLDACAIVSEDPPAQGFAASTLGLAQAFRLSAWTEDGLPGVGTKVRIPIRYSVPPAAAAKP